MKIVELILKLDLEITIEIIELTLHGENVLFIGKIKELDFVDFYKWRNSDYCNTKIEDNILTIYTI